MHFVICVFIALLCLVTTVLFTNVFPKWLKLALTVLGSFTSGYAISILIRKIAMLTNAFEKPELMPVALIAAVIVFVVVIIVKSTILKKK